jgi:hypothetical protein
MAVSAYPKPSTTISTDQFRDFFRQLITTGAVTAGGLAPSADSSGLNVKIAPGFAVVDGIAVNSTAIETRSVGAGSGGGLSRIDTLVANLDFSATPIVQFVVIAGTPAATGAAAPSLALSGSVVFRWPIANIAVSPTASTIIAGNVTDRRTFSGKEVGVWTTTSRPTVANSFGLNTTLGILESTIDGTTWKQVISTGDPVVASQISAAQQLLLNVGRINGTAISVQETAPTSPSLNHVQLW